MFGFRTLRRKKIPLKTPREWLECGLDEIQENMILAGCVSFDFYGYTVYEKDPLNVQNLFKAYNEWLRVHHFKRPPKISD